MHKNEVKLPAKLPQVILVQDVYVHFHICLAE